MMLGNLSLEKIEDECGIKFPEPFRTEFARLKQEKANNIEKGKWHCFHLPLTLVCGGKELFEKVRDNLIPMSSEFKTALNVIYQDTN